MLLITATFPSSIDMTWSLCPPDMNCSLGEGMIGWLRGVKRPSPMQGTSLMSLQMPERLSRGREKVGAAAVAAAEEDEEEEEEDQEEDDVEEEERSVPRAAPPERSRVLLS